MSESPNVFISWSGDRSARAAKAIAKLLPDFVPAAKPWLSISSIDKGVRWREATAVALESANAGIFCLTPENLTAPWLLLRGWGDRQEARHKNTCLDLLTLRAGPQEHRRPARYVPGH